MVHAKVTKIKALDRFNDSVLSEVKKPIFGALHPSPISRIRDICQFIAIWITRDTEVTCLSLSRLEQFEAPVEMLQYCKIAILYEILRLTLRTTCLLSNCAAGASARNKRVLVIIYIRVRWW
jgi:hypothetical protein